MARELRSSGIEWIGDIPRSWKLLKGKYLFRLRNEKGNSIELQLLSPTQKYGVIPQQMYEELSGMTAVKLDDNADLSTFKSIYEGDFCISLRSFQGGFEYSNYNGVVSPAYQVFYKTTDLCDTYYRYMFKDRGFIEKMTSYTKTFRDGKSISFTDFGNSLIPVPPIDEQERIACFLDTECVRVDAVIEQTRASIEEYKKLKQSVITQAVTKGIRPDRPMKDSGIEWIGEIPESYKVERVKHLGSYRNGLTYTPDDVVDEGQGTLVLRSSNVQQGKLCFEDNVYVDAEIPERLMVQKGDIIICSRNGSRELIGKCAIVENDLVASFGAFMMIFRGDSPKYMYYILNSSVFKYYLSTFLTSTINQLTGSNFGNMAIVWCNDISEQNEIVDYLDKETAKIDTLISQKETLLAELESYKKALIFEYVTGKKEVPA